MFKKIAIAAMLGMLAFARPPVLGGFRKVDQEVLQSRQQSDQNMAIFEQLARDTYRSKHNGELGNLVEVYEQVVAGINYKMVFQTENGEYEVTVFSQPWTQTTQVLEMKPFTSSD